MKEKVRSFRKQMENRRSYRHFSTKYISKEIITGLLMTASTAPSGANKQPWLFCAVSNPDIKKKIRKEAEKIEYETYSGKISDEWKKDLEHLKTNWEKEFLENAPWIIVVFKKSYNIIDGQKMKNYYVNESVGLATGILIAAIHNAGLASLTYTPSPMSFLTKILNRPENEKPYMVIPIGYPGKDAFLPEIKKKKENEIIIFY
jgi:nitroreductase